jgi:hypothetical protein
MSLIVSIRISLALNLLCSVHLKRWNIWYVMYSEFESVFKKLFWSEFDSQKKKFLELIENKYIYMCVCVLDFYDLNKYHFEINFYYIFGLNMYHIKCFEIFMASKIVFSEIYTSSKNEIGIGT